MMMDTAAKMTATTASTPTNSTPMMPMEEVKNVDDTDQHITSDCTDTKPAAATALLEENSLSDAIGRPLLLSNEGKSAVAGRTKEEDENDPRTRVLKRGDLVKVAERREARVKNRDGGLARIQRAISIPSGQLPHPPRAVIDGECSSISIEDAQSRHPYKYDVDWVLGGRIFGVPRSELIHTTAEAEGLADRSNAERPRRKRRATTAARESEEEKTKAKKTKATTKNTATAEKNQAKTSSSSAKKNEGKTASARGGKSTKKGKKKGGSDKSSDNTSAAAVDRYGEADAASETSSERPSAALDMYERHLREFEKSLVRLERVDQFGFFLGKPLPVFDDVYSDDDSENDGDFEDRAIGEGESPASSKMSRRKKKSFPAHPPFNWTVVRKRKERGRYVLDRVHMEKERRKELLAPYWAWLGEKNRGKFSLSCNEAVQLNSSGETGTSGTVSSDLDGPGSNPGSLSPDNFSNKSEGEGSHILHPIGVDWDLFYQDVIGMCNASIGRDPRGISGGSGTLGHAANKIKDIVTQIYNRAGKRHAAEMALSDATYKFNKALGNSENNEAAMQGDWRKEAFPERKYERLSSSNVVCAGLSALDERSAIYELRTSLPDRFVGISYVYDDIGESEGWMKSIAGVGEKDGAVAAGGKKGKKGVEEVEEEKRTTMALASDEGVVRAQVRTTMNHLLTAVQDRVMTENGVLQSRELRSANWEDGDARRCCEKDERYKILPAEPQTNQEADDLSPDGITACNSTNIGVDKNIAKTSTSNSPPEVAEQPVWGIDCYSRRNISLCLETEFTSEIAVEFIEKWLLPAINSCPVGVAHDMSSASSMILEAFPPVSNPLLDDEQLSSSLSPPQNSSVSFSGSHVLLRNALTEKIRTSGPPWLRAAAFQLNIAIKAVGLSYFRVHPKGHGSVVLKPEGLRANTLVTYYRGEVYPPWRWGEKMDAIEKTQQRLGLRPNLPDFYNMALERPHVDPRGYGMLFVDASRKAGLGSSFSHSCDPTCEVRVSAVNGQLCLAMTTLREVERGEELAFDYNAVTESLNEYRAAICLCGHSSCRGSFLHFATADCYQQVMCRNSPIAVRFAGLVRGCMKKVMSKEDEEVLKNHGFGTAAFGAVSFNHHRQICDRENFGSLSDPLDSMDYIPIWLRTFVADTLRYIEYERRALPVAILCNHISKEKDVTISENKSSIDSTCNKNSLASKKKEMDCSRDKRGAKGSKASVNGKNSKTTKSKPSKNKTPASNGKSRSKDIKRSIGSIDKDKGRNCLPIDRSFLSTNEEREVQSCEMKCDLAGQNVQKCNLNSPQQAPGSSKPEENPPPYADGGQLQAESCASDHVIPDSSSSANVKKENFESGGSPQIFNQSTELDTLPSDVQQQQKSASVEGICDDFLGNKYPDSSEKIRVSKNSKGKKAKDAKHQQGNCSIDDSKPIAGSKPEPVFIFFSRKQRDSFNSIAHEQGLTGLKGLDLNRAVQKIAGQTWRNLSDQMKQHWKDRAFVEWEMNGGREKAHLEEERKRRIKEGGASAQTGPTKMDVGSLDKIKKKGSKKRKHNETVSKKTDKGRKKPSKSSQVIKEAQKTKASAKSLKSNNISFEAADAEGWSAMEQRIQQLTQALSRVGRVLDRHRESSFDGLSQKRSSASESFLRGLIHSPVAIMPDTHVVGWLWNEPDGVVRTLLRHINQKPHIIPSLGENLNAIAKKYEHLEYFEFRTKLSNKAAQQKTMSPSQARQSLREALLELRECLVSSIRFMEDTMVRHEEDTRLLKARLRCVAYKRKKEEKNASAVKAIEGDKRPDSSVVHTDKQLDSSVVKSGGDVASPSYNHSDDSSESVPKADSTEDSYSIRRDPLGSSKADSIGRLQARRSTMNDDANSSSTPPPSITTCADMEYSKNTYSETESCSLSCAENHQDASSIALTIENSSLKGDSADHLGCTGMQQSVQKSEDEKKIRNGSEANSVSSLIFDLKKKQIHQGNTCHRDHITSQESFVNDVVAPRSITSSCAVAENSDVETNPLTSINEVPCDVSGVSACSEVPSRVRSTSDRTDVSMEEPATLSPKYTEDTSIALDAVTDEKNKECDRLSTVSAGQDGNSDMMQNADGVTDTDVTLLQHFLKHRKERYKLETAADLLLLYAHTSTFFSLEPYSSFETTPIEVYARELGNSVPRTVIEVASEKDVSSKDVLIMNSCDSPQKHSAACIENLDGQPEQDRASVSSGGNGRDGENSASSEQHCGKRKIFAKKKPIKDQQVEHCEPDDIITYVKVKYSGDYVLSQLLQWYNGGIGQKPGLPNMTGCVMLPTMSGCWTDKENAKEVKLVKWKQSRITNYSAEVRPKLIDWLEDRFKRGNPWSDEIACFFDASTEADGSQSHVESGNTWQYPMGSPVLDFLVTGDDTSIFHVLQALRKQDNEVLSKKGTCETLPKHDSTIDALHSSVDEGMPVQAVANWVQCENPKCLKWRKLPWHVDTDLLPENFFCKDNIWNPESNSCDAPEDVWNEDDALVKSGDTRAEMAESSFVVGARFDVLQMGKSKYHEGGVAEVDFVSESKRVKFSFPRLKKSSDEWVELNSGRIAPLNTYTIPVSNSSALLTVPAKHSKTIGCNANNDSGCNDRYPVQKKQHQEDKQREKERNVVVMKKLKKKLSQSKTSSSKSSKKALFTTGLSKHTSVQKLKQADKDIRKKTKKKKKKSTKESQIMKCDEEKNCCSRTEEATHRKLCGKEQIEIEKFPEYVSTQEQPCVDEKIKAKKDKNYFFTSRESSS